MKSRSVALEGLVVICVGMYGCGGTGDAALDRAGNSRAAREAKVRVLFDLGSPAGGPFPSDHFTVPDDAQNTGLRVNLPKPDCSLKGAECNDIEVLNTLDGFNVQPRLSIPFSGPIDVKTVSSAVFLVRLGPGRGQTVVGIDQIVWDTATNSLHVESDELLEQHTRYALLVTQGVRDPSGNAVEASDEFEKFRQGLNFGHTGDADLKAYRKALLEAVAEAAAVGLQPRDVIAASVFTTQSVTAVLEKIRDQIKSGSSGISPRPDFVLGSGAKPTRTVFPLDQVSTISWKTGEVSPAVIPLRLDLLKIVPDQAGLISVGQIAFGKYASPNYLVDAEVAIPQVGTRTGTPVVRGSNDVYFNLVLPAGAKPTNGWPVAILGHGAAQNKNTHLFLVAATMAKHGIATIEINAVGRGFGALGTLTVNRLIDPAGAPRPPVTFFAGGRGIDQDGDHVITATEGGEAPLHPIIEGRDAERQTVADLMQLVRVIEVGMDVDGDSVPDLDASRIYYLGFSYGANYGTKFVAIDPSVRAVALHSPGGPLIDNRRLGVNRNLVGGSLASRGGPRGPPVINRPGINALAGVAVGAPFFDDNIPLRNGVKLTVGLADGTSREIQSPITNTVAGAMEIQEIIERTEWVSQGGNQVAFAPYLQNPLVGMVAKPVLVLFGKGDRTVPNPAATALLRAGDLAQRATFFRNDVLLAQEPRANKDPHGFLNMIGNSVPLVDKVARAAQEQVATFFETDGARVVMADGLESLFEVPIAGPLPEDLNFARDL